MSEGSEHPEVQWALDILAPDSFHEPPFITKYAYELFGTGFGISYGLLYNLMKHRPLFSTIPMHIGGAVLGLVVGNTVSKYVQEKRAIRDAGLRDYIIRHPEDFPAPVRKKWGEILEPWDPRR